MRVTRHQAVGRSARPPVRKLLRHPHRRKGVPVGARPPEGCSCRSHDARPCPAPFWARDCVHRDAGGATHRATSARVAPPPALTTYSQQTIDSRANLRAWGWTEVAPEVSSVLVPLGASNKEGATTRPQEHLRSSNSALRPVRGDCAPPHHGALMRRGEG